MYNFGGGHFGRVTGKGDWELKTDFERERVLRLSQGFKLPSKPCRRTLMRYINEGRTNRCTGQRVYLEAVKAGGFWYTSIEAFHRFCDRLTSDEPFDIGEN